jgi:hypothetical protein
MRLWKGKDHIGIDSSLSAPLVLSHINLVHATTFHFSESFLILFSIYSSGFARSLFPWSLSTEKNISTSVLYQTCYRPSLTHCLIWHMKNISYVVQNITLLVMWEAIYYQNNTRHINISVLSTHCVAGIDLNDWLPSGSILRLLCKDLTVQITIKCGIKFS